jgi:hypothetical protein
MAERQGAAKGRSSGGSRGSAGATGRRRSGGSKDSGGAGRGSRSRALSTGAGKSRSSASTSKGAGGRARNRSSSSKSARDGGSVGKELAKAATGGTPMGRPPAEEPDVFVDVPNVHVGKLEIDVERLQAHLALRTQVANLVALVAGVHAEVDRVKILIEDVDASALRKVRLANTYNILDRTLTTIDENPEILMGVVDTLGTAVEQVGEIGTQAAKPGGALGELTSGVGNAVGNLGDGLGDTVGNLGEGLGDTVGDLGAGLGDTLTSMTDRVNTKRMLAKAAARLAAGGAVGVLGGVLYRASRRPRVLGIPVGRKRGLELIGK